MATWEDGPEYAPLARPDHFAEAEAARLPTGLAPAAPGPAAPVERPAFDQPGAPVAALEDLVPPVEETRDPEVPFDIAASSLTEATSAWSAAHWSRPTDAGLTPPAPIDYASGSWPAQDHPYPPPALPVAASPVSAYHGGSAPPPGGFPAPGTTSWFAPPPVPATPAAPGSSGPGAIAASLTPGLIICLVIGGLVWPLAPITFALAFALTFQMKAGRALTRILFAVAAALLVFVLLVAILLGEGVFGDWWELLARWAQALSWVLLVVSWIVVYRDLRGRAARPPRSNRR